MKKIIWVNGLIAGVIVTAMMLFSAYYYCNQGNFDNGEILGYGTMILAFSFVFVGIKTFRDRYNGGSISFGKAFKIGFFITLVASTMYVLSWQIDNRLFFPDFAEKYAAHMLANAKASGISAAELAKKTAELKSFQELYKNPFINILMTYAEILPVGLVITLISALILKRKKQNAG